MFLYFLCHVFADSMAQDKKEAVVLYNTQAVRAVLNIPNREIDRIISYEDDFLKGFTLEIPDYEKFLIESATAHPLAEAKIVEKSIPKEVNIPEGSTQYLKPPGDIPVFSYIKFAKGYATLSDEAILLLEKVVREYEKRPGKITLRALSAGNDNTLSVNRAQAVKTYLRIRGINTDMVTIQHLTGPVVVDNIMVVFPEN